MFGVDKVEWRFNTTLVTVLSEDGHVRDTHMASFSTTLVTVLYITVLKRYYRKAGFNTTLVTVLYGYC